MTHQPKVAIIGAGISGLYATYRLAKQGVAVTLFEAGPKAGGALVGIPVGETYLERFYHHFFRTDHMLMDTLRTLDIRAQWTVTRTGFVGPGPTPVTELSAPHQLLMFDTLSVKERISLGIVLARVMASWKLGGGDISSLDDVSAEQWLSSWGGEPAYQAFFRRLIAKKYGVDTPNISAAWMVGRLMMRAGRDTEGEVLGYPIGSFKSLCDGLVAASEKMGATIHLNEPVESLLAENGRVCGIKTSRQTIQSNAVISTANPRAQAKLLRSVDLEQQARQIEQLPVQGAIVGLVGLERRLSPHYWINVMDMEAPFGALVEQTLIMPEALYGGPTLYVACYPDPGDPMWDMSETEVTNDIIGHLKRLFPEAMANNGVRWSQIGRTRVAGLIYKCGVKQLLPPWRTAPGMFFTGMFRCYPRRPVDLVGADACACADVVAAELLGQPAPHWTDIHLPQSLDPPRDTSK